MRRSSRGVETPAAAEPKLPELTPTSAPRLAELCMFEPTHAQLRARAAFWVRHRADPLTDPTQMTGEQVARALDLPSVAKWWRDPGFRNWFLQREEWREEAEYSLLVALRELSRRLRKPEALATKDITISVRMLADLTGRTGRAAGASDEAATKQLSDAESMRAIHAAAIALGYTPPAALPAGTPDAVDVDAEAPE